eukprot:60404-Chlamydomonas_euryale.AAC.1
MGAWAHGHRGAYESERYAKQVHERSGAWARGHTDACKRDSVDWITRKPCNPPPPASTKHSASESGRITISGNHINMCAHLSLPTCSIATRTHAYCGAPAAPGSA